MASVTVKKMRRLHIVTFNMMRKSGCVVLTIVKR